NEEEKSDDEDYEETEKEEEKEEDEPPAKKINIAKKEQKPLVSRGPKREMECPKCMNYRSTSVEGFQKHFKSVHGITPFQAGIMFLCDCGIKSSSPSHLVTSKCTILNFTLIQEKRGGVKCILCESQPTTAGSYSSHLLKIHQTTLLKV
ncbi:hypothetical protein PFISCL1PPCAC_21751, partial [Pristionchus fissidentatus]